MLRMWFFRLDSNCKQCHISTYLALHILPNAQVTLKCKQLLTPFSSTVFYAISDDAIHFLRSVNFKNNLNESFQLAIGEMPPVESCFWCLYSEQNGCCTIKWKGHVVLCHKTILCAVLFEATFIFWRDVRWFDATLHKNKSQLRQDIFVQRKLGKTKLYFVRFLL